MDNCTLYWPEIVHLDNVLFCLYSLAHSFNLSMHFVISYNRKSSTYCCHLLYAVYSEYVWYLPQTTTTQWTLDKTGHESTTATTSLKALI